MALEVIGAGFGRTGTRSLQQALQQLGFTKCYHMAEVFQNPGHSELWEAAVNGTAFDWDTLFEGYRAGVDWPVAGFWRELADYYPDAKLILSTRDPEGWFKSVHNTIYPDAIAALESDHPDRQRWARWVNALIWEGDLEGTLDDHDAAIEVFNRHLEEVREAIPPERLLVFEATDGWEPLCAFLDVPVPAEPYPRTNTSEEWQRRSEERSARS
jgi:hypothetical protein